MLEQTRTRPLSESGPSLGGSDRATGDAGTGMMATVSHWPYSESLPVANMTVGEVRRRYADRFDIDPRSQATLDGDEVGDDTTIAAGQILMFVRRAGEKGAAA